MKTKEIKIPGPDHPISITASTSHLRIMVDGKVIADSTHTLLLEEQGYPAVYYVPREDADMSLLLRTTHYTYCPYKGDCSYYSIPAGGAKSEYAVWTYEQPYQAVQEIRNHLAFYPGRVDEFSVIELNS